ncbi:hypothetical protein [Noviherbaspirillum sp.]|uniref:hypothetical protein n=1 Tax=Noviherbaspirillum sp. TaxID=1926288 RepID=UPI002FE004C9
MLKILRSIFGGDRKGTEEFALNSEAQVLPSELRLPEKDQCFPFADHVKFHLNLPLVDWDAVHAWIENLDTEDVQAKAWTMAEHAWLTHLQAALGNRYHLIHSDTAILLSPLEKNVANATIEFMGRTLKRVIKVLDGIADVSPWGKDILIVFENEDQYYDYVSYYYPEDGEFAFSGGMFISAGCSHFVTVQSDLRTVEPVIAHEMTHACLSHLPIPLWLNEGLAVNTEHRLTGKPASLYSPQEMRAKHLAFWDAEKVQEFWFGKSFSRTDDGNMLSYDLARILVETFSKDWASFKQFVIEAKWQDGGAEAARLYLGGSLGDYVSSLLEKTSSAEFEPALEESENPSTAAACATSSMDRAQQQQATALRQLLSLR